MSAAEQAVEGMPAELAGRVDPAWMIRPMLLVRTATMVHVAVPMQARTDVVPGLANLGTNRGLGICPMAACGQRLAAEHAEKARHVGEVRKADAAAVSCLRCRGIVEAIMSAPARYFREERER